jgi:hypothetical protein
MAVVMEVEDQVELTLEQDLAVVDLQQVVELVFQMVQVVKTIGSRFRKCMIMLVEKPVQV